MADITSSRDVCSAGQTRAKKKSQHRGPKGVQGLAQCTSRAGRAVLVAVSGVHAIAMLRLNGLGGFSSRSLEKGVVGDDPRRTDMLGQSRGGIV